MIRLDERKGKEVPDGESRSQRCCLKMQEVESPVGEKNDPNTMCESQQQDSVDDFTEMLM